MIVQTRIYLLPFTPHAHTHTHTHTRTQYAASDLPPWERLDLHEALTELDIQVDPLEMQAGTDDTQVPRWRLLSDAEKDMLLRKL